VSNAASLTVPAGKVISQNPPGSSTAASFSSVNLVVSIGVVMSNVPNVTGLAQASAASNIAAANFVVGNITNQHDPAVPTGNVISQNPAGGSSSLQGSAVNLVVSMGPDFTADYGNWATRWPVANLSDSNADFDGDGLSNNDERAWGLDPTSGASCNPIRSIPSPGTLTLSYTRRSPALTGLGHSVWTSPDMLTWAKDNAAIQTPGPADADHVEIVNVTLSITPPPGGKLFVQVRAN
jgi:hypothetical protein